MNQNAKNIEIVVKLLKENNIRRIVISPGGTNIPLVKAIQKDDHFICYSVVDERSAIYFAIGLYLQTGEIIATSCTSAQATRNYIPGLTEAFYKRVPIIAITMSKHPRFTYQEYMQAPDQASLPNDCVKKSFVLPFITDEHDIYHSIRVSNEAICEVSRNGFGPVQLCIPWLDFAINNKMPTIRNISIYKLDDEWNVDVQNKKIMLAIGEHRPFTKEEKDCIERFCQKYNVMVYTNHLSNYCGKYSINGNFLLSTLSLEEFRKKLLPDIFISIGGQTGDYPLYKLISLPELDHIEHWRVSEDGQLIDTYDKLTKVFQCSESSFFNKFNDENVEDHSYFDKWMSINNNINTQLQLPFSNVAIAQYLSKKLPKNSVVQFSILNSLRVWELFDLDSSINCFSNVGAFGIDGGLSTLIGHSFATDEKCFMIIGDLAFFYDMNSIGIRGIKDNVRILLVNNNGGIEFKLGGKTDESVDEYIAAANHFKNAKGWSETCGFKYLSASNMDEFIKYSDEFVEDALQPILFEVFVSDIDESQAYLSLIDANKEKTIKDHIKSNIKNMLGQDTVTKIKKLRDK